MQRGELGKRKAMVPWMIGSPFHRETERERERRIVCRTSGLCKKSTSPESSWRYRERERVKTFTGDWTRNLFHKIIDKEKGQGFYTTIFL